MELTLPTGIVLVQVVIQFCVTNIEVIEKRLYNKYGEVPFMQALTNGGSMIRFFGDKQQNTWTMTMTNPRSGETCIISTGEWFNVLTPEVPGEAS